MRHRRGYTLIEMTGAMALTSAALALLAGWMITTLQNQRQTGEHLLRTNARDDLAEQFRRDVHAARNVVQIDGEHWRLQMAGDRQVEYLAREDVVRRVEHEADTIVHQEQYGVAAGMKIERDEAKPERITLALGDELRIEAALGADRRWEGGADVP